MAFMQVQLVVVDHILAPEQLVITLFDGSMPTLNCTGTHSCSNAEIICPEDTVLLIL